MSSNGIKYRKNLTEPEHAEEIPLEMDLSRIIIPYSEILHRNTKKTLTDDSRKISLSKRDPLFRALMRIEFESACREYIDNLRKNKL